MKRPTFEHRRFGLVKAMVAGFLSHRYPASYTCRSIAKRLNHGFDDVEAALCALEADGLVGLSSIRGDVYFNATPKCMKTQAEASDTGTKAVDDAERLIARLEALSRKSYKVYRDLKTVIKRFNPILTGNERGSLDDIEFHLFCCYRGLDDLCDLRKKEASEMGKEEVAR